MSVRTLPSRCPSARHWEKRIRPLAPQARQNFVEGVELREFGREIADPGPVG
ncbi:hypothetical protein QA641_34955 [Bradyrhizobium sp. CB1650]|uniref:hypothetical protein n=1 Tax=Bradyrhizobium sp. CB1650 TaxID=3039153 RepID=UPI002434FD25|nr:hypothetical protein [Bradyrhizobium sp. CB1650]WGD50744.1 hypothetical protein QA641_34955 [Bradyrhizobium sp. CB1650]